MVKLYMKVGLFFLLMFFVFISPLGAKVVTKQSSQCFEKIAGDNDEFMKYRKDFISLYNLYLNNDIIGIESFIDKTAENGEMSKYIMFYFNALANYHLGFLMLKIDRNKGEALEHFNQAKDLIDLSLKYNDKFNESLRLASDIYMMLARMQPLIALSYVSIIDDYSLKSNLINANNPLLDIHFGVKLHFTPSIFGGDNNKAKEMFEKAYDLCPLLESTSYRILRYDYRERKIDKKTCDFYAKHKDLMNVKIYEWTMIGIKKQ